MLSPQTYKVVLLKGQSQGSIFNFDGQDIPHLIHPDDSIGVIKRKIALAIGSEAPAFQEMYLFGAVKKALNPEETYRTLTMNGTWPLTSSRMAQFLLNVRDLDISALPANQDEYTYDDILSLDLGSKLWSVLVPLGHKFVTTEKNYSFAVNPFDALSLDGDLARYSDGFASTSNGRLLMESGDLIESTIYLCMATDVVDHVQKEDMSVTDSIAIYYPFLNRQGLNTVKALDQDMDELRLKTKQETGPDFQRGLRSVNMFYSIENGTGKALPRPGGVTGLTQIRMLIPPAFPFTMPLDIVFKLSKASVDIPFIKHNPVRGDSLYRLYASGTAADGRRVPALSKPELFKLVRETGKTRSVIAVTRPIHGVETTCVFRRDGAIELSGMSSKSMATSTFVKAIQEGAAPILEPVRDYLAQRGYSIGKLTEITSPDTKVLSAVYRTAVRAKKAPDVLRMRSCIAPVFVASDASGTQFRFRRVANYDPMNAQDGMIADMLRKGEDTRDVRKALEDAFSLTAEEAQKQISEFLESQTQGEQGLVDARKIRLRSNPGFATTIAWEPNTSRINVEVSGIDGDKYLETVPMYVSGLLRLILKGEYLSEEQKGQYTELCEKAPAETPVDQDLVSAIEDLSAEGDSSMRTGDGLVVANAEEEADLLALMGLGSDDDTDDDDTDEDDTDDDGDPYQMGGADPDPSQDQDNSVDPTGMVLSDGRGNWVLRRMRERDPKLFKIVKGANTSYSRSCPWAARRMPVILTDEEKARIDKENPGSYEGAVRYGSPGNTKHWFICPRYWNLSKNTSLKKEGVDSTRIIPEKTSAGKKVTKVPDGKDVVEFCSEGSPASGRCTADFRNKVPGFLDRRVDSDSNLCLPCCFDRATLNKSHQARLKDCARDLQEDDPDGESGEGAGTGECDEEEPSNYIVEVAKFGPTLRAGKFGFLSPTLQRFLGVSSEACYAPGYGSNMKPKDTCVVRKGVEQSRRQSFIACVASAWIDESGRGSKPPCIKKMREILKDAMTLDTFVTLQNGSLITIFGSKTPDWPDAELWKESKLYADAAGAGDAAQDSVKRAADAYRRYREFLSDGSARIDHTYIWDLVTLPNPAIFPHGINLAILEVPERDGTDNVRLLCPTNHYARPLYHARRSTLVIVRQTAGEDAYYEPVFVYTHKAKGSGKITRRLRKERDLPIGLKDALDRIASATEEGCGALPSLTVRAKSGIPVSKLVRLLTGLRFEITHQLLNYNSKVVGVRVRPKKEDDRKNEGAGIVPCEPSAVLLDLDVPYAWIGDSNEALLRKYKDTVEFLRDISVRSKGGIPTQPLAKVLERGMVIGVITETDQFVPTIPDIPEEDGIETMSSSDPFGADKTAFSNAGQDKDRLEFSRNMRLEGSFFRAYRDTLRVLLNAPSMARQRGELQKDLTNKKVGYTARLNRARKLIESITKDKVGFVDYDDAALSQVGDVPGCAADDACTRHASCQRRSGNCVLAVPRMNLVNRRNNEEDYPIRLADEVVRYSRIREFMFRPERFLAFGDVRYNLGPQEMILPGPLLTPEYFDTLVAIETNAYAKNPSFDTAQPQKSKTYTFYLDMKEESGDRKSEVTQEPLPVREKQIITGCADKMPPTKTNVQGNWRKLFPKDCYELVYPSTPPPCTFQLFMDLCSQEKKAIYFSELKESLAVEYTQLLESFPRALLEAFRAQGKSTIVKRLASGSENLESIVLAEDYYATSLDYWILAGLHSLPIVFYSGTKLIETGQPILVANATPDSNYYYIKIPGKRAGEVGQFRLVARTESDGGTRLPIRQLDSKLQDDIRSQTGILSVREYLTQLNNTGRGPRRIGRMKLGAR